MDTRSTPSQHCCPELDVARWDKQQHIWKDKLFLRDSVRQIFHIPINFGSVVTRMYNKVVAAGAAPEDKDFLILAYDPSPWKSHLHMSITKEIPDEDMAKLTGTFISRVFDGPYNAVPNWIKEMDSYLAEQNLKAQKYYFHYAYCPKCAKKYGHNYCVAFAQVA